MGVLDDCFKAFGVNDLYKVLEIEKNAVESAIKRAYRKISLKVHPDRASEDDKEASTFKFQVLSKVTKILLDKDLRELYDETGQVAEDDSDDVTSTNLKNFTDYFRSLYKFDINEIVKFVDEYRESELETQDLKDIYVECEGDMDLIFEKQMASRIEDEDRYRKILDEAIKAGEIPSFDAYVNETKKKRNKRKRFYEKEAKEADELKEKLNRGTGDDNGESSQNSLMMMIRKNQQARKEKQDEFLSSLEAKYCQPKKKTKKTTTNKRTKRK